MDADITTELTLEIMKLVVLVLFGGLLAWWLLSRIIKQWRYINEIRPYYAQPQLRETKDHSVYIIQIEGESNSQRVYVGVTNNFKRRFSEHKEQLESGSHTNHKLQSAFDEGGRFIMHRFCADYTKMQAYSKEHQLRPKWNMGFNIAPGGLRGIHF